MAATIAIHEFLSLDGVFEDPAWTAPFGFADEMGVDLAALTGASHTILLGRRTYEMFAPAWRDRSVTDDPGAPFFNDTEKVVVGSTPLVEQWNNTTSFGAYDADRLRALKAERDGVIYVSGSGTLVRGLLADGLVDDLHLMVYPVALGSGERLWADDGVPRTLALASSTTYPNGVVHLHYRGA